MVLPSVRTSLLAVLLVFGPALFAAPAQALPLFARKYSMPCNSCHVAFPRLNAFGRQFRQNGYRMAGDAGTSPWEDKSFPISFVADVGYAYASTSIPAHSGIPAERTNTSQFQQNAVELHTAGTLAPHLSFHVDSDFQGVGQALESGMAFVQLDDLVKNGALNLKAGIYDADIPYLAASRTLTAHEYLFPLTLDAQGLELNGTRAGWTYAVALVNSGRTEGERTATTLNNFENPYAWVMRDLHGHEVAARVLLDRQDPRNATANASSRVQLDLSALVNFPRAMLTPAYSYERHGDPDADHPKNRHSGMLEATVLLDASGRWVAVGRYELQHTPKDEVSLAAERDFYLATVNLSYYLNPNARLGVDFARTASNHRDEPRVTELQAFVHVGY